jgi:hypothetical protein
MVYRYVVITACNATLRVIAGLHGFRNIVSPSASDAFKVCMNIQLESLTHFSSEVLLAGLRAQPNWGGAYPDLGGMVPSTFCCLAPPAVFC